MHEIIKKQLFWGGDEMYGERVTEIYNTICKINSQWGFAVLKKKKEPGLKINTEIAFTAKKIYS